MVNSLSPPPSGALLQTRSVSPAGPGRAASAILSNVTASASPHPIQPLLESLNSDDEFVFKLHNLYELQRQLVESPEAPDVFRLSSGFESVLESLTGIEPLSQDIADFAEPIELLKCVFNIFSDALINNPSNRRYFAERIGFDSVTRAVLNTGLVERGYKQILGIMFSFMVSDFSLAAFFLSLSKGIETLSEAPTEPDVFHYINDRVSKSLTRDIVRNAFVLPLILDIVTEIPENATYTAIAVVISLYRISQISSHNRVALHNTQILDKILPYIWNTKKINGGLLTAFGDLINSLIELGVNTSVAKDFFREAMRNDNVAKYLLFAIKASRVPAHIVFDQSLHGYSTIEFGSLGRTFPPPSNGYTLTAWIKVIKYDSTNHTTLFGVFDNSQRCFTLVYLEKETCKLILQTSVTSSRGSVRFKSVNFEPGQWYFICLSHKKSRVSSSSKATLYINGEFSETVKCPYPSNPPNDGPAQAFIGTPADLSPYTGQNIIVSKWQFASLHIFEDVLSDDVIAVHYRLGPRYYGNYQDALGSFQTYEASSALNLRNESLHTGREDSSDIISAIRGRASNLLPESKIILSVHANNVISPSSLQHDHGFRQSPKSIINLSRNHLIIVNAAVPDINIAFASSNGIGVGSGDPVPVIPQSLDDAAWRLGGSALGLKMTELARTPTQLRQAVSITFELLRENWRNSDDMERVHGFAILANIIKSKSDPNMIDRQFLNIILEFVGYNFADPLESIINNPLAYRILLVDFDIWKNAHSSTLEAYFDQFSVFGLRSKYHTFNAKRLTRMRIVKKFLQALKSGSFTKESLDQFIPAFRLIILTNVSAEVMRSISLFIAYALTQNTDGGYKKSESDYIRISRSEVGYMVLKIFTDILCDASSTMVIKKFARTVTNKWVLFLISQDDRRALIAGTKILARLLIIHGNSYVNKFATKTGGFLIMKERLKSYWSITELWPICLAILFGIDIATLDIPSSLDLFHLVEMFRRGGKAAIAYPEMFAVIGSMLKAGALTIISEEHKKEDAAEKLVPDDHISSPAHHVKQDFGKHLQVLTQFFSEMHASCPAFQDFCATPVFIQEILGILFPAICNSESVSPEVELQSRDSTLSFDGDIVVRPATSSGNQAQILKSVKQPSSAHSQIILSGERPRASSLRRGSSFVLVTSELHNVTPASSTSMSENISLNSGTKLKEFKIVNRVVEGLLEIVIAVLVDQVLTRKDFSELSLSVLIPPTFQEYQIYFETYLFRNTVAHLQTTISLNLRLITDTTRTLINFGKFAQQLVDSVFSGWFIGGAGPLLELIGMVIEYLQQPAVEKLKNVRLCHYVVTNLRLIFMKLVLFRLSELDDIEAEPDVVVDFLQRMLYWQNILLSPSFNEGHYIKLNCYLLYILLIDKNNQIQNAAADLWRMVLVHKPVETSLILDQVKAPEDKKLSGGFKKLMEMDNRSFLIWMHDNREPLDDFFLGTVSKEWEAFVVNENKVWEENARLRLIKRRERLRHTASENNHCRLVFNDHKTSLRHWRSAIYMTEHLKFMRNLQDRQDNLTFLSSEYSKLEIDLTRSRGILENGKNQKWRLDLTEGRDRMRKRMIPDNRGNIAKYLPKGEESTPELLAGVSEVTENLSALTLDEESSGQAAAAHDPGADNEDGFEIVEDPRGIEADDEAYEDKNRKVLRSLEQGDSVVELWNVCRIIGLDSVEGLLILGRNNLYLIDNFFQMSDGEIVNLWDAPPQERDQYLQTIAGKGQHDVLSVENRSHDTRHWSIENLVSVSRRQFLFRNVALEFFFADGRSFLITSISVKERDQVYNKLIGKVSNSENNARAAFADELWRYALHPSLQGGLAGQLGKIANVFTAGASNPVSRRWIKGEISNFYYLMLVNTMAGRTYNDLTQYPVFPWVIADYTSEELDLNNPATFRDLSKPMGAQTSEREKEFRERYYSLADLNDTQSPPFHYGTHFSSAMIVASYLIRLEPFVQSYLLLQGGHFDHADRLFYSIEKAWQSASRDNMADVRELIPEFFYLPEFLVNSNEFNFGTLQGSGAEISSVQLPPWAKNDPKIFIQKNREALESEYVSQHLHEWIDLVFGFKQRGEAAVEATNVFHHLSYHGAIDLEKIEDPLERIATIGIIHNFGQTPHQIFTRSHPSREVLKPYQFEVPNDPKALFNMLSPLSELKRVDSFKGEHEKLIAQMNNSMFCVFVPPNYDKMVEWGFCDNGVRFKLIENGKLIGHVEQLHQSHLTCVKIADPRTLVTAGYDCMISVWKLQGTVKSMEVQFKASLRGHTTPIVSLAISRSFSAIVSASEDGLVLVWDLNRLRFVRELRHETKIKNVAMSDETGEILTSDGSIMYLWTINGDFIFSKPVPDSSI
ncbi:hypothetical protein V1514DRAFT_337554 [Lipomyces japonicus]|uniref:uncharacterized protein n=1 Tax=Lipomyces japonicus TaxID=56871 RepID=UPI0034CD8D04